MCKYVLLYFINSCYKGGEHNMLSPPTFFFAKLTKWKLQWIEKRFEHLLYIVIMHAGFTAHLKLNQTDRQAKHVWFVFRLELTNFPSEFQQTEWKYQQWNYFGALFLDVTPCSWWRSTTVLKEPSAFIFMVETEAAYFFKMVPFYQTTQCYISEHSNLYTFVMSNSDISQWILSSGMGVLTRTELQSSSLLTGARTWQSTRASFMRSSMDVALD